MALGTREDGTIRKGVAVACGGETQDGKSMLEGSTTPKQRRKKMSRPSTTAARLTASGPSTRTYR